MHTEFIHDETPGENSAGRIHLEALRNTRDLGYLSTRNSRHVLPKKLIRSGALSGATKSDLDRLVQDYQVRTVIDLRTPEERQKNPDPEEHMPGVAFYHAPILGFSATGITRENGLEGMIALLVDLPETPLSLMQKLYPRMLLDEMGRAGYSRFFEILLQCDEGAVLWHCSAGKDRAGLASVLLLHILNVSPERIRADYLATNRFLGGRADELLQLIPSDYLTPEVLKSLAILNSADESFLDAALTGAEREYGSLDTYLKEALGVDESAKKDLREKFLHS